MYRSPTSLHLSAIKNAARATRRGDAAAAAHWAKVADYFHRLDDRLKEHPRRVDLHQLKLMEGSIRVFKALEP